MEKHVIICITITRSTLTSTPEHEAAIGRIVCVSLGMQSSSIMLMISRQNRFVVVVVFLLVMRSNIFPLCPLSAG